jgi:hypothetical protein
MWEILRVMRTYLLLTGGSQFDRHATSNAPELVNKVKTQTGATAICFYKHKTKITQTKCQLKTHFIFLSDFFF